ncbi:MAG: FecCD family ABC transporter permease [Spirochaetota bacterium]
MTKFKKNYIPYLILCGVLAASFIISVSSGPVRVPLRSTLEIFLSGIQGSDQVEAADVYRDIILKIRLPRVLLGMVVGASLSIAGLIFQALLKNPLADPYTLGISAGASLGAGLSIFLSHMVSAYFRTLLPVFAFMGGFSTIFLVYFLARSRGGVQILTIILSGVIVSYLFSSGVVLIMSLLGDRSHQIIYWLMGSLSGYHRYLAYSSAIIMVFIFFTFLFYRDLDLMALGDDQAKSLGVNTEVIRLVLFSSTSLITAIAVSMTGTIGFVGLIVPHSMRLLLGPRHKRLIPASVLAGAAFLPLSDTLGRVLPGMLFQSGLEIPVGVITSLFGSPFFIFLLIRGKKKYWF